MLALRAKRAHVPGAAVHEAVPDHLVLALETPAALAARAARYRAVVWSVLGVHVPVGTDPIVSIRPV